MINSNALPWIEAGYEIFSLQGPKGLKIELLARKVGISKSSFYHHFVDLDVFTEMLMEYHLEKAADLALKARTCTVIIPDYLNMILEHKQDHFFNQQLQIHRNNYSFHLCFERAINMVQDEFIGIWAEMYGLSNQHHIARSILKVVTELFYHRITPGTLTYEWMIAFLDEMNDFMKDIIKGSGVASQLRTDKQDHATSL